MGQHQQVGGANALVGVPSPLNRLVLSVSCKHGLAPIQQPSLFNLVPDRKHPRHAPTGCKADPCTAHQLNNSQYTSRSVKQLSSPPRPAPGICSSMHGPNMLCSRRPQSAELLAYALNRHRHHHPSLPCCLLHIHTPTNSLMQLVWSGLSAMLVCNTGRQLTLQQQHLHRLVLGPHQVLEVHVDRHL
jgi:hypothetical protein